MAAKRTAELIPLCHPLPLSHVDVTSRSATTAVEITADRRDDGADRGRDGGADGGDVAALTVYDMAKAIDKEHGPGRP